MDRRNRMRLCLIVLGDSQVLGVLSELMSSHRMVAVMMELLHCTGFLVSWAE